ncbi:SRPBCC family protein [Brevibacterium zhoupengii]|uniref:SRPBCC family protein n=1 Tax=Brevibacterium zhoupengii TaxID=2898795 RepID=UPI001F08D223|nr:SRPBCC family protein [Brevibacterium zhoupengii]
MNFASEINSVIRRLVTSGGVHQVVLERTFDTDVTDLWNACTNPQRLSRWFEPISGDLALGGRYALTGSGTEGDILRCEAPRQLAITWEYEGDVSYVDVDLIETAGERTVLRLTHHVPPGEHWETYGPGATGVGWEEGLRALSLYLSGGARAVPDGMEEDMSSSESQKLIRLVAHAWGQVDEEAGTPAGDAEARALKTAEFYVAMT